MVVLEETRAPLWWIFMCGLIAISAMVLPGLSGSFLLLFMGQYHAVFSSIHQCIGHVLGWLGKDPKPLTALTNHAWIDDFLFCGLFGLGVLLGLAAFSRVVSWLFERTHDFTMAALTGLMIGALRLPGDVVLAQIDATRTHGDRHRHRLVGAVIVTAPWSTKDGSEPLSLEFSGVWVNQSKNSGYRLSFRNRTLIETRLTLRRFCKVDTASRTTDSWSDRNRG